MARLEEMGRELDGKTAPRTAGRSRGSRRLKVAVGVVAALVVMLLFGLLYGTWRVGQIDRVELGDVLPPAPSSGATWLIVGSDSREGIDPDRPDAGGLIGEPTYGQRADAIILVRDIPGVGAQMLSLPRDLWLDPPGDNNATRINGAYNDGPAALVDLIWSELGIAVHHYADVNLAGLDDVVDAVGSVTMHIPNPGYDDAIGLRIDESGDVTLDGATALAYVRTRKWTEIIDGVERYDPTGDLGRNQRQQAFLRALGSRLMSIRNPFTLNEAVSGIVGAVRVDDSAGTGDMYSLAKMLRSATRSEPLPVVDHVTGGGAYVLLLGDGSDAVLDPYRV